MDVITLARELGAALQEDPRYLKYLDACELNDSDRVLQDKIEEFNKKRATLGVEMRKPDKDADLMTSLDREIRELYDEIMAMPKMVAFNEAKAEFDALVGSVNFIIQMASNGEDPMTCPETPPAGCTGSCSGCSGCS